MNFDIGRMIAQALESVKSMLDVDTVVGKPVFSSDDTVILPVSKISVGFFTGGGEIEGKNNKMRVDDLPIGGLGGGLSIMPLAFIVISQGDASIIKVDGNGGERWMEVLQSIIKNISKK